MDVVNRSCANVFNGSVESCSYRSSDGSFALIQINIESGFSYEHDCH